jgi:hypothetical protein
MFLVAIFVNKLRQLKINAILDSPTIGAKKPRGLDRRRISCTLRNGFGMNTVRRLALSDADPTRRRCWHGNCRQKSNFSANCTWRGGMD